jgi:hypothetical protein
MRDMDKNTSLVQMTSLLLLKSPLTSLLPLIPFLVSHLVFLRLFNDSTNRSLCYSGWRVASGGWHVVISEVEGCQTDRLLILLVFHILVLHPSFLVVQSEKGDGTMTSEAESVCCVSG